MIWPCNDHIVKGFWNRLWWWNEQEDSPKHGSPHNIAERGQGNNLTLTSSSIIHLLASLRPLLLPSSTSPVALPFFLFFTPSIGCCPQFIQQLATKQGGSVESSKTQTILVGSVFLYTSHLHTEHLCTSHLHTEHLCTGQLHTGHLCTTAVDNVACHWGRSH